jgi:branched-chain amino acid transport system ATP-binding protein
MRLSIRGLNVEIQASHILHNVEIDVNDGELVCLVGRNGAGKTTTLRTVMGFLSPTSGSIELDGESIIGWSTDRIAQHGVGFAPEESEVFTSLTVGQNIEMPTWVRPSSKSVQERIDLAYSVFPKLRNYVRRQGDQLSGGERKMLSIARALALDAGMLLLDEPFEGLSPTIIPEIAKSIRQITQLGLSVLQAESNLHHVADFTDKLYVIERGEIIFSGSPRDAYKNPDVMRVISGDPNTSMRLATW